MKKRSTILFLVIFLFGISACTTATPTATVQNPTQVTLALGYLHNIQFAPFYLAAEKGYFRDAGIDIQFEPIFEDQSLAQIGVNGIQFGMSSADQVLLGRAQNLPLVYVAVQYQEIPIAVVARDSLNLRTPADLKGQSIGIPGLFGASYLGLRAILQAGSVSEEEITLNTIGFTQLDAFLNGETDVVVVYANNELLRIEAAGESVTVFRVGDYLQLVGNGLITNEQTIQEHPELVQGMVNAMIRGMADTIANPEEAFASAVKYVPELETADSAEIAIQKQVLAASIKLMQAEQLGASNNQAWENTAQVMINMGLFSERPDISQAYTNEYLP